MQQHLTVTPASVSTHTHTLRGRAVSKDQQQLIISDHVTAALTATSRAGSGFSCRHPPETTRDLHGSTCLRRLGFSQMCCTSDTKYPCRERWWQLFLFLLHALSSSSSSELPTTTTMSPPASAATASESSTTTVFEEDTREEVQSVLYMCKNNGTAGRRNSGFYICGNMSLLCVCVGAGLWWIHVYSQCNTAGGLLALNNLIGYSLTGEFLMLE